VKTQSLQAKQKQKISLQNLKNLGMLQTTTLKRNLVPEIGEARKKEGFGLPRWLPPLKEAFVGSLGLWVLPETPWS
jgi:hypothetical protein